MDVIAIINIAPGSSGVVGVAAVVASPSGVPIKEVEVASLAVHSGLEGPGGARLALAAVRHLPHVFCAISEFLALSLCKKPLFSTWLNMLNAYKL